MAIKRTAPIAFYAKLAVGMAASERATNAACARRVLEALHRSHAQLAKVAYVKETDLDGEWLWIKVEGHDAVFTKADLKQIAEAVRAVDPETIVWLWIQDDEEREHGVYVLLDKITPDEYRRD